MLLHDVCVGFHRFLEQFHIFQEDIGATGDAGQRIVGDPNGQTGGLANDLVDATEQTAAAGEHDARFDQVGGEFRLGAFERVGDRVDDFADGLLKRFTNFLTGDDALARQAADHVAAADFHGGFRPDGTGGADFDFDFFRELFADHEVIGFFHMADDGFIKIIAGSADGFSDGDVREGEDGDFRGAAADVDDHAGAGFGDGQPGADGRGERFFHQINAARLGLHGGMEDGLFFHRSDAGGNGDDDARLDELAAAMHAADEIREHRFGDFKIADHTMAQRTNSGDAARGFAEHFLGGQSDGVAVLENDVGSLIDGDDGWFIQDYALPTNANQGITGAQVNAHVEREPTEERIKKQAATPEKTFRTVRRKGYFQCYSQCRSLT